MSKAGINRVVLGTNTEKTRCITIISSIRERKTVITRLSGICPECQEQYPDLERTGEIADKF